MFSHEVMPGSLQHRVLQYSTLHCPSPSPGVCLNSCPLSQWCHSNHHPLWSPSLPVFSLFKHQGHLQWFSSLAKVLELQHQSFQWIFRVEFIEDWLVWSPCSPRASQECFPASQFKSINSLTLSTWLTEKP